MGPQKTDRDCNDKGGFMIYYRSEADARKLIKGRIDRFKDVCRKSQDLDTIVDFVMESHVMDPHDDLRPLGFFERILPDFGVQVRRIRSQEAIKLRIEPKLLMEIEQIGIVDDAIKEGNYVALYGRLQQGRVVEAVALNTHSLPQPNEA